MSTVVMHGSMLERTPDQRQRAMTDLRDYLADDGTQKAFDYVNMRASKEGLNPKDMERIGNHMLWGSVQPVRDTLKAGVKQGLMDQAGRLAQAPQDAQQTEAGVPYYEDPNEMAQMYPDEPVTVQPLEKGLMGAPAGQPPASAPSPEQAIGNMAQAPQDAQQVAGGGPYYEDPAEMAKMYPGGQ